MKFSTRYLH